MTSLYFFCPNPACSHSKKYHYEDTWYRKTGFHKTKTFGKVQRYICKACGKTFSDQTFLLNYYLKIKTDFRALTKEFNSSSSDCFIARNNNMSFESVRIRRDRLARNALFLQDTVMENHIINEALVADGLESFTRSRYYINNVNVLVGSGTGFLYYFTESHSKRKGQTTKAQKKRIKYEYRDKSFTGCALRTQFTTLLKYLQTHSSKDQMILHTDMHKTYPVVLAALTKKKEFPDVVHYRTSSKNVRNKDNPLSSVNNIDRQFRKDIPNFRRTTVCHAKNDRNLLSRVAVYMATNNFFKPKLISDKAKQVEERHYTGMGLDEKKLNFFKSLFFDFRFFLSKVNLSEYFRKVWLRKTETPFAENWYPLPGFAVQ